MTRTLIPADQALNKSAPAATPRAYRPGSKKGRLVELLQCRDGVSVAHLAAALGWRAHTTRAALTGLRKDGHALVKLALADGERASRYRIKTGARR